MNYAFLYGVFYTRKVIDYVVNVCRLGLVVLPNVLNVVRCLVECGIPNMSRSVRCPRYYVEPTLSLLVPLPVGVMLVRKCLILVNVVPLSFVHLLTLRG